MASGLTKRGYWISRVLKVPGMLVSSTSDLLLAFFIVSVIGLMILPLPLLLLDTLVAANIALGIMLVMMSIYVNSALQFSAFPSVLLISTLFRLALSVATTRMILLNGDAGNIIDTFGQLVAGGNIVVGLVVFLIITLVQFLVIAKGSERVAEVGARFTLDAMPGKQLSIDSDLRSGLIDKSEARSKRADLETESQLHGSLDGAMKFVKGDAIAGIVIIIVNLLGGLAVGVFQLDMSASAAMQKYSILTIGDGMVAQIPALFGAMAAGLIVTRVSDADSKEHLGDAIQNQFASIPRVILVAGGMCCLFAAVPGFPTGVFLVMGFILLFTGGMLIPAFRHNVTKISAPAFDTVMQRKEQVRQPRVKETATVIGEQAVPLLLNLPASASKNDGDTRLRDELESRLNQHYKATGVKLPTVQFLWHREEHMEWALDLFDVPVCKGLITDIENEIPDIAEKCIYAIRRNTKLFVGIQETAQLLNRVSETAPEVVKEVQRALSLQGLSTIIKNLAEEEVPIKNLSVALEALIETSQNDKDLANLTEYARISMGRQICNKYADQGQIRALGMSLNIEEMLLNSMRSNQSGSELSVSPQSLFNITRSLDAAIRKHKTNVIVVPVVLRRQIRNLVADIHFDTAVLSYPEIIKPFELNIVERVSADIASVSNIDFPKSGAA